MLGCTSSKLSQKILMESKCINFLDVLVDNSSTTVATSTFRKPTNTGLYSKLNSFVLCRYKCNLVNCWLDRAYKICRSHENICSEMDNIKAICLVAIVIRVIF